MDATEFRTAMSTFAAAVSVTRANGSGLVYFNRACHAPPCGTA
jgi:hypothetical protein